MGKDLFSLDLFSENENTKESEDIFDINIDESADVSIPVPGGLKETPTAKPHDANSIPIPSKTTITADEYNCTIGALKKSFKEAVGVLEALEGASIVDKTPEQLQMEFTESCLEDALLESFDNGPLYEAVNRDDKEEVKAIVRKLREKIQAALKEDNINFYKPKLVARCISAALGNTAAIAVGTLMPGGPAIKAATYAATQAAAASNAAPAFEQIWGTRLWQVLGVIHADHATNLDIGKRLTEKFKDELGGYKILTAPASRTIYDMFKTKFGWKNQNKAYFLLVDKKLPSELKEVQNAVDSAAKNTGKDTDKK